MKKYKKILDTMKLYFRHRTDTLSFFGVNQYVDWKIIISTMALLFLVVCGIAAYLFMNISNKQDPFDVVPSFEQRAPIKLDAIKKVIEQYEKKATDFETLRVAPYTYPEPYNGSVVSE